MQIRRARCEHIDDMLNVLVLDESKQINIIGGTGRAMYNPRNTANQNELDTASCQRRKEFANSARTAWESSIGIAGLSTFSPCGEAQTRNL